MTDLVDKRLQRIEDKLDRYLEGQVRLEERAAAQSADTNRLSERVNGIEGRVEKLETRTGWLPGVERLFWVAVAGVASWMGRQF